MAYCSQADLEIALGGADVLRELSDHDQDGVADDIWVVDFLESGAGEIRTAVEIKHDPETIDNLDSVSLRRLRDANAALSARIAYEKGAKAMAMPEGVSTRADRTDRFLTDLAEGRRRLGRGSGEATAAINQPVGVVDYDSHGCKVSVAGFKKGFR